MTDILHKNAIEAEKATAGEDWFSIVKSFPYYPVAQFGLLHHYKKVNDKSFDQQASVTALFITNKRWLQYQLHHESKNAERTDNNLESSTIEENIINQNLPEPEMVRQDATQIISTHVEETSAVIGQSALKNKTEDLAFEPLYTVDYFASQGIKITEEMIKNDKLGTQLKSFTEWLKSMKRIHANPEATADEQTDKIIQHLAETSNSDTNVITEAMAEVLLKQNKVSAAIDMYKKLSLNFPDKSSYFAAKINSLKSI